MKSIRLMNRVDTKFLATREKLARLLALAQPFYRVQVIDGQRIMRYHTLYFDTPNFVMYLRHQNGCKTRQKVRVRSYVDSAVSMLEVKTKNNHGRTKKKRITLPEPICDFSEPLTTDNAFLPANDTDSMDFLKQRLWYDPTTLTQHIENRFERITLVNNDLTERLTIDLGLRFHNLITDNTKQLKNVVIIELKRDGNTRSPILELLRQVRIMPEGFSKYCMGAAMTNPQLKANRFKERLRLVEKMEKDIASGDRNK